jgi:hypothetical protein
MNVGISMSLWRKQFAKLVIWLLAGTIPAQPVLSLDCACHCHTCDVAECCDSTPGSACPSRGERGSHSCDSHHRKSNATNSSGLTASQTHASVTVLALGLRPCQCPADCDCHLKHEARAAVVESTKVKLDLTLATICFATPALALPGTDSSLACRGSRCAPSERSALEICAHLCRFTS